MNDKIEIVISAEEIAKRVEEVAAEINRDYEGKEIRMISVLRGSVFFACDLARKITVPLTMDFMSAASYGANTISSGNVKIKKDLDDPIDGLDVLIVEDIIDTGNTLACLIELLKERGAKSIKLCTLLDKPVRRRVKVDVAYNGFEVPDEFIVGYGLDYDQEYRNLPYIGAIRE